MTDLSDVLSGGALRRAAVRAIRAPSVHNTQPWQFVLTANALEIRADRMRQLRVLDPMARQLHVSCGCALFNARVALAAAGHSVRVERLPDPADPDLLARLVIGDPRVVSQDDELGRLDPAVDIRQTNRRRFTDEPVPQDIVDLLVDAAQREAAEVFVITRDGHRLSAARLNRLADQIENTDPAGRAELRAWTGDAPGRVDGVPAPVGPPINGSARDESSIRDVDRSGLTECLLLVGTPENSPMAWLKTGEALERILLEIAGRGYTASPFTQLIEVARTNALLRQELALRMHPHILLRVGRAPGTQHTRRRRLVDVITEAG